MNDWRTEWRESPPLRIQLTLCFAQAVLLYGKFIVNPTIPWPLVALPLLLYAMLLLVAFMLVIPEDKPRPPITTVADTESVPTREAKDDLFEPLHERYVDRIDQ